MAVTALPINASGGSPAYTARATRQAFAGLLMPGNGPLAVRSGFRPGGAPTVSVDATTWSVGPFTAVIDPRQSSTQGPYLVASDGTETGAMTPADGTFARRDILYVQVDDADEDSTGQRRARVLYQAGTPASSPATPGTPSRSLLIGIVDVPKVGSGSPVFTPSLIFTVAAGGILPDTDGILPPTGERYLGQMFWRLDLEELQIQTSAGARVLFAARYPSANSQDYTLNERWYGEGLAYTVRSNATNVRADVDAAMTLSFQAPDTGKVWIELEGMCASTGVTAATGNFGAYWCLRDTASGNLVPESAIPMVPTGDSQPIRLRYSTRVSGLTPGQSYTYAWQHFRGTGATGTAWWYIGGGIKAMMRARRSL